MPPAAQYDKHWLDPPDWWRRRRPLRWLLAAIPVVWLMVAFAPWQHLKLSERSLPSFFRPKPHPETGFYTRIEIRRVPMVDRFRSYDDLSTVTATLASAGFEGWTSTSRRVPLSSEYPPYNFDTVRVEGYRHLGEPGRLTLLFFNNRLFQAEFTPDDAEAYARRLRSTDLRPRGTDNARAEKIEGDLRMLSTVALAISPVGRQMRTEPFVMWQDLRLIRARDAWDARYGAIPKPVTGG
jgi:hypothetical protein